MRIKVAIDERGLSWHINKWGEWVCSHEETEVDPFYNEVALSDPADPTKVDHRATPAEICLQCGSCRRVDEDGAGWHEDENSLNRENIYLQGGII